MRFTIRASTLLMLLLVLLGIAGCRSEAVPDPKHVAILLYGDSRQPQADGFIAGLAELGYEADKNVRYTILNAKNDRTQLEPMVEEAKTKGIDLFVPCGGLESDAAKKLLKDTSIPVVNIYNNTIVERGLVDGRKNPGWNITGVDSLSAEISAKRVELIHDLLPTAKTVLVLYYEKIAPSRIGKEHAEQQAAKIGMRVDARAVTSREDIQAVMNTLNPGEVDAMLLVPTAPIDNALREIILPRAEHLKLPVFGHSRALADAGALASYGASFYEMGAQAARLADKVMRGIPASSLPFETPKRFFYVINKPVLERLGIPLTPLAQSQIDDYITESNPQCCADLGG